MSVGLKRARPDLLGGPRPDRAGDPPRGDLAGSRLGRLIRAAAARAGSSEEVCELCAEPIPAEHRHLLELDPERQTERLRCVCRSCSLLFDRRAAGGARLRLIPDRRLRLDGFRLDDGRWAELAIPVGLAYFVRSSVAERVHAFYPGPMGATESRLRLEAWAGIEADNPVLGEIELDVEALLVRRVSGARDQWLVPVDACYRLVALLRTRWQGPTGGREVWDGVTAFFDELAARARPLDCRARAG